MKNCCNCGAPFELNQYRCNYCGTLYLDLSMIDFDKEEPFFLTIKKNGMLITQKVKPETADMYITDDTVYATGRNGQRLLSITTGIHAETNIQFTALPMDDNKIYAEMRKINDKK